MAYDSACDGVGRCFGVDRSGHGCPEILESSGSRLVGQDSPVLAAARQCYLPVVRLVDSSALTESSVLMKESVPSQPENAPRADDTAESDSAAICCPVCGGTTVQEKCKVICRS